jgi:hypothetical protein
MKVPNIRSRRRGVVHTAGQIRLLRCGTGTSIYDLDSPTVKATYERTGDPVTCQVCLKMPVGRDQVPLKGCGRCGKDADIHTREANHYYEVPTELQTLVRSSLLYGDGKLEEIPSHLCNKAVMVEGTDEVPKAVVAHGVRVIVKIEVAYQDHLCSLCGNVSCRVVLGQAVKEQPS